MYRFAPLKFIQDHLNQIIEERVSLQARSPNQFLDQYKRYGKNLPIYWVNKRNAFIARVLPTYLINTTFRRWLSLVCWAYKA